MVRKSPVTEFVTSNYTKKTITIRPDADNQVFTFKQVQEYCNKKMKDFKPDAKVVVTGLNILRNTTLKGYDDDFMSEDSYEEYAKGKVNDSSKFDKFYSFTITIRENHEGNLFIKH